MASHKPIPQVRSEPTIVTGVVHPHGVGGGRAGKATEWTLRFAFETWRGEDGVLNSSKLTIRRQVTEDELRAYMTRIRVCEVFTARVLFTEPESADLIELLGQTTDASDALVQRAAELLEPKTREHKRFGTFTLDRRMDWYIATVTWAGREIRLNLFATDDSALEAAIQNAVELWENQSMWNQRIREYAVQQLLDLKNSTWLEEDEDELTPDDFKNRMSLEEITMSPDGEFDFWHDDGALFWGHTIQVSGNLRDGPIRADIPG